MFTSSSISQHCMAQNSSLCAFAQNSSEKNTRQAVLFGPLGREVKPPESPQRPRISSTWFFLRPESSNTCRRRKTSIRVSPEDLPGHTVQGGVVWIYGTIKKKLFLWDIP